MATALHGDGLLRRVALRRFHEGPCKLCLGYRCPGGDYANGNTDPTLCDNAPVFQAGGPDGPVLYRVYDSYHGGTSWVVGPSDRLNDCSYYDGSYLISDSNPGPLGGREAPTAPVYGWLDGENNYARTTITVTAGDGSATGGGGGGGGH